MYKLLFFLHKTDDEDVIQFFKDNTVKKLEKLIGEDVGIAYVESNLLLEQKFTYYCEISVSSKEEMDRIMHSKAGKELNKSLMDFHKNITVIAVNYNQEKK
ncbi:MAG: hypothetical protein IH950_11840 [Bacteroidetes bacterium]|nr:hypothetical protein [Bacteroidota bacterium]MCH8034429.1 hypothetical protein [Bacteroidota bacterium]